jgi:hypothetical protein
MTNLTAYSKEGIVNYFCRRTEPPMDRPILLTVHLHTADSGDAGSANEVDSAVWTDYSPVQVNTDGATSPYMTAATQSGTDWISDNVQKITFTTSAVMVTEGTSLDITHASVRDHNGNVLLAGPLLATVTVVHNAPVHIPIGSLDITGTN